MADFPEAGVRLVAETDDAMSSLQTLESELDSFTSTEYTTSVIVELEDSAMADAPTEDTDVTTTNHLQVEQDEKDKKAIDQAEFFFKTKNFETIWNWTVKGLEIFTDVGGKLINPILNLGDAVAKVGAQTGGAIPNADKLINGIFYDDLGQSKEEVGKLIVKASELNLPVEKAARAALTFTHTWSDTDSVTAITTFGTLLHTNLVGSMEEAADLMAVFFQQGGDKGGDALTVVNSNAESWSNMGLTATQALSTISSLLKGNVEDASTAAKMMQTLDDSLTLAAKDAQSPQAQLLRSMGLENPKDKGQAMGADFIDGFAEAFAKMPTDQQDIISGTFMGKGGKKFTGAIQEMTANSDMFKNITGAAELAAKEIDNSLRGAIDDFVLVGNKKMEQFLSSEAIDIPGKIEKLKQGLQNGLDVLAQGGTLGEALTIALKPIGFDDEFQTLEKALGDFVIGILQAVATLQDITGHGDQAAGTRATVEGLAKTKLAFDLSIANSDEIAAAVATATSRGLSAGEVTTQVSNMVQELVTTGTADTLAQAQTILDEFKKNAPNLQVAEALNGEQISIAAASLADGGDRLKSALETGIVVDVSPNLTPEHATALQEKIDAAFREAPPPDIINQLSESMGLQAQATERVSTTVTETANPMLKLTDNTRELGRTTRDATPEVDDLSLAVSGVEIISGQASLALGGFVGFMQEVIDKAHAVSESAGNLATAQAAVDDANVTSSGGFGSGDGGGPSIMEALLGYIAGGAFFGGGNVNNTINNNNSIPNTAVADALGYRQAATLRGAR